MAEPDFHRRKNIGIIGYGRFGKFLSEILAQNLGHSFKIIVFSRRTNIEKNTQIEFLPLSEISRADVVIPCIPISIFEEIVTTISPMLKENCVVIDVCSVKVFPIEIMTRLLRSNIQIIGSHPVFGPDSYKKNGGLKNLPIVLTQVRCEQKTFARIKEMCSQLQLHILEMTAEEHDKYAAYSQAYAFLIGKISQEMNIQPTPIDTMWYQLLIEERNAIEHDSTQLFFDIQERNPFAAEMRQKFKRSVDGVFTEIEKDQKRNI